MIFNLNNFISDDIINIIFKYIHNIDYINCMKQIKLIAIFQCKCPRCLSKKYRIH